MAGSKEDAETVTAFFQDRRARGLGDPLLVVSDGAPGVIKVLVCCGQRVGELIRTALTTDL
jgi:putative transposase